VTAPKFKLRSPYPFKERLLFVGGGGAGKTEAVLQIARHTTGTFHVFDNDYSYAYGRALATEFADVGDRMVVHEAEATWEDTLRVLGEAIEAADADTDWLVIDSISPTWDYVQTFAQQQMYGDDKAAHMLKLRSEHTDDMRAYHKAVLDDMNWPAVKAEYSKLYRMIQRWRGHLVLTAEAKALGTREDDEVRMIFGHLGVKPAGEGRLHHASSSTFLFTHPKRGEWRVSTAKDRNRAEFDNEPVENFAVDYLRDVAGWEMVIDRKRGEA
jgi:hypothetical protein